MSKIDYKTDIQTFSDPVVEETAKEREKEGKFMSNEEKILHGLNKTFYEMKLTKDDLLPFPEIPEDFIKKTKVIHTIKQKRWEPIDE